MCQKFEKKTKVGGILAGPVECPETTFFKGHEGRHRGVFPTCHVTSQFHVISCCQERWTAGRKEPDQITLTLDR